MANLSKIKRDNMIAFLEELKKEHSDDASIRAFNEIENHLRDKKYGLIWEEHSEAVDEMLEENIPVLTADPDRRLCKDETLPWNFIIEGDNLQALYLLEKTHRGKVDCIYIDPPYNTGATDWKYNNDYVGKEDEYRHSKWLSMMKNRLLLAKHLLNPNDSVLIVTIDEKEYLRLGCLLEELFPTANIQMINLKGTPKQFLRLLGILRTRLVTTFVP
jgi:adenine-specific DNA-methyltransferase